MARKHYPEFHKSLMEQSVYPEAPRRIKVEETSASWIYKTGVLVYKIPKPGPTTSSLALKEMFLRDTAALYRRWAPELDSEVVPILKQGEVFVLGGAGISGTVVDYALKTRQLPDAYWVSRLLEHGKFNATGAGKVAKYLAQQHLAQMETPQAHEEGRPEHFRDLMDELLYQSKKYTGTTVTQPMLDLVLHPTQRFLDDERKLMLRRQKKGLVLECHGAFLPRHVFLKGGEVLSVSPLVRTNKFRTLDAMSDVAAFANALLLARQEELADLFIKRYFVATKDRDGVHLLPLYQALQALRSGLQHSERQTNPDLPAADKAAAVDLAHRYYAQAVHAARDIGKT